MSFLIQAVSADVSDVAWVDVPMPRRMVNTASFAETIEAERQFVPLELGG
jgi:hypothetical protein